MSVTENTLAGSGSQGIKHELHVIISVYEDPIVIYVTFEIPLVLSFQFMDLVPFWKTVPVEKHRDCIIQFSHVVSSFFQISTIAEVSWGLEK